HPILLVRQRRAEVPSLPVSRSGLKAGTVPMLPCPGVEGRFNVLGSPKVKGRPARAGHPFWSRSLMPIRERVNSSCSVLRGGRGLLFALAEILPDKPRVLADLGFELHGCVLVLLEEAARRLAALADALALEGEPRAGLLH